MWIMPCPCIEVHDESRRLVKLHPIAAVADFGHFGQPPVLALFLHRSRPSHTGGVSRRVRRRADSNARPGQVETKVHHTLALLAYVHRSSPHSPDYSHVAQPPFEAAAERKVGAHRPVCLEGPHIMLKSEAWSWVDAR